MNISNDSIKNERPNAPTSDPSKTFKARENFTTSGDAVKQFVIAMREAGLQPPAEIIADGCLHRFMVAGDRAHSHNGWYVLHGDEPAAGAFGCWKRGVSETWCSKSTPSMTPAEKAVYAAKLEIMRRKWESEQQRIYAECRQKSKQIWDSAPSANNDHPYLKRKGVQAYGIRLYKNSLVIPLLDITETIHGLQFIHLAPISPDSSRDKNFKTGTDKKGHFFIIGDIENIIIVCEGYATGASIHQATGHAVVVAFDSGNLLSVAKVFREKYPDIKIVIACDNDHSTSGNPGLTKGREAAKAINAFLSIPEFKAPEGKTDFNDLYMAEGADRVKQIIEAAIMPSLAETHVEEIPEELNIDPLQEYAANIFPYQSTFPWQIFPGIIADSLLACAESCATSPTALAGVAFAILSSAIGRTILISPKTSWNEPLHCWFADIRPSGEGKTPAMQLLARVLHEAQSKSDADFENEKDTWEQTPKKERGPEPRWNRSYFVSGLTLEGIRAALWQGHGGFVCLLSELSSFITGQGQYKSGKGDDREAWLSLHDGSPARIVRAGNSVTIQGARVSICGGIQPEVFRSVFGDKNGLFLTDGTVFRFLLTYESAGYFELTRATWGEQHRFTWENLVNKALWWADDKFKSDDDLLILKLSDDAWNCFSAFRNNLYSLRNQFPPAFRGFIPKVTSYILRITGLLHVMDQLFTGDDISPVITAETIQRSITAISFYMGHTLEALKLLHDKETLIQQDNEREHIITALESLSTKTEAQGFVTVTDIAGSYNTITGKNETAKYVGRLLREIGLEPKQGFHGRYGIRNEELQKILKTKSPKSPSHPAQQQQGFREGDFKNQCHLSHPDDYKQVTWVTSEKQSHHPQMPVNIERGDLGDLGDLGDFNSKEDEFYKINYSLEVVK